MGAEHNVQREEREVSPARSILSSDELDEIQEQMPLAKFQCAFCSISSSPFWYRGFINWSGRALCVYCGQYWRKYAAETASLFLTDAKRKAAQEQGSEERGLGVLLPMYVKYTPPSQTVPVHVAKESPQSLPVPEVGKCVMCRRADPRRRQKSCAQCGMIAHQGCVGFSDADFEAKEWFCDLCRNDRDPNYNLLPHCVLCDEAATDRGHTSLRIQRNNEGDNKLSSASNQLTALDVYKPTECNNWVHLVCATWTPEILYGDAVTLQPVEGAGSLPPSRYDSPCTICNEVRGSVVTCSEPSCRTRFHVSCAFQAQPSYTLAFEIFPVKTSRRDSVQTLTFKSETGHMCAQIWCKEHRGVAKSKTTYDFYESDTKQGLTALQAFTRTHKQVISASHRNSAMIESSHALLRRAKRFDTVLQNCGGAGAYIREGSLIPMIEQGSMAKVDKDEPENEIKTNGSIPKVCTKCKTDWSPFWWPLPDNVNVCCTMCRPNLLKPGPRGSTSPP